MTDAARRARQGRWRGGAAKPRRGDGGVGKSAGGTCVDEGASACVAVEGGGSALFLVAGKSGESYVGISIFFHVERWLFHVPTGCRGSTMRVNFYSLSYPFFSLSQFLT